MRDWSRNCNIPFYEPGYVLADDRITEVSVDLGNPRMICAYLKENVYKQDKYCRDAAMILFNHIRGITSRNIVCGPAGCGKTLVWQCLKKIWPRILFVDASVLTKSGWKGGNIQDFLKKVDFRNPDYIIVFDEFDKCVTPQADNSGANISSVLQSEFLKVVEGSEVSVESIQGDRTIDTSKMSFVFCGSFAQKAGQICEDNTTSGFGFGAEKHVPEVFEKELTIKDVIDFGVIPELASRTTRIINVRPLTLEDYRYLITRHPSSPVKKLEKQYGRRLRLSSKKIDEIARCAFESGLGIRNVTGQLQQIMDERVYESFPDIGEDTGGNVKKKRSRRGGETHVF